MQETWKDWEQFQHKAAYAEWRGWINLRVVEKLNSIIKDLNWEFYFTKRASYMRFTAFTDERVHEP